MSGRFLTTDLKGHIAFFVAAAVLMIFTCNRRDVVESARIVTPPTSDSSTTVHRR